MPDGPIQIAERLSAVRDAVYESAAEYEQRDDEAGNPIRGEEGQRWGELQGGMESIGQQIENVMTECNELADTYSAELGGGGDLG